MSRCSEFCGQLKAGSVLSAILVRIIFCLHCLIAFWRIMVTTQWDPKYFALLAGLGCLLFEAIYTLKGRRGAEYKWFCPSVFFYLLTIVPCVWIIELDMLNTRLAEREDSNFTRVTQTLNITILDHISEYMPVDLQSPQLVVMLEQMVQFILILGRWMLPKGNISRDELSQLLMVYIGISADIIEFFETFKEERVTYNKTLIMCILGIWSGSLLQFCLVLTASKSPKSRPGFKNKKLEDDEDEEISKCEKCCSACFICSTEVVGILSTMFLQDAPFLTLRLLLFIKYNVRSYMHIFFTVKNSLVLIILIYRLLVLTKEKKIRRETLRRRATERADKNRRLKMENANANLVTDEVKVIMAPLSEEEKFSNDLDNGSQEII